MLRARPIGRTRYPLTGLDMSSIPIYTAEELRSGMTRVAEMVWRQPVRVGHEDEFISRFFRDIYSMNGGRYWSHHLEEHSPGGYDDSKRSGDRLQYCGLFLSWVGLNLGIGMEEGMCVPVMLHPNIAYYALPSTVRVADPSMWSREGIDIPMPDELKPSDIQKNDIVTVSTHTDKRQGDHFALVEDIIGDTLHTFEANANGSFPGEYGRGRGVVHRTRRRSEVKQVIRLDERHFIQGFQ